jgi:hypothetical protein
VRVVFAETPVIVSPAKYVVEPSRHPPNANPVLSSPADNGKINESVIVPVMLAGTVPVSAPLSANESA